MTYGEYIEPLMSTGLFGKNKADFAQKLFLAAGPTTRPKPDSESPISISTIKSWLKHPEKCRVGSYFPTSLIKEDQFIYFLKSYTRGQHTWKKLQEAFSVQRSSDSISSTFCVDLETEDSEMFYWSLLNQFQRIFHLPESEREAKNSEMPIITDPQRKLSSEEIRNLFITATHACGIMDLINRKPAILNRDDSARLNAFLDRMDFLIPNSTLCNNFLHASIRSFIEALRIQVLTLDANLNNRFSFDDETASINMEDDKDWEKNSNPTLPDLTLELILESADPVNLGKIAVSEWGNFRDKMNHLFNEISSWQSKS